MRSKRLLAILLAFCLVFTCFAPAASAVEASADSAVNAEVKEDLSVAATEPASSPFENEGLISGENAADSNGALNLRDDAILKSEIAENTTKSEGEGTWEFTQTEKPENSLLLTETPECIEELKEAAQVYAADEVVRAFVVMEEAPLADSYKSRSMVSASVEKQMIEKQDSVIAAIERTVLAGEELKVRYQFTYLTNSFTIETEFANLEKIAYISGVKSVFVAPVYNPCEVESSSNPNTWASGEMTGVHTVWNDLGYTGEGMKIAVIDTGLDLDHPSFGALDAEMVANNDNYLSMADVEAVLTELNAYASRSTITAKTLYRSTKVPYAFNYVDANLTADHTSDSQGDHGTHVSGIAAANAVEGTSVVGMAPDAQIIVMKVFGANGGAYTDDIVAALEDAMTLGCDVVNASLGSPAGFSSTDSELDLIYERLASQDIIACFSAGNEGTSSYDNMWGTDLNNTADPDNSTVGSPSTYVNAFSIASAENSEVQTPFFALADGYKVFFTGCYEWYYGYVEGMNILIDEELEYVMIDGLGYEEDYYDADGNSLVEGKVAVVSRGTINFGTKIYNAEVAGAVACVVVNNNTTDDVYNFYMSTSLDDGSYPSIPSCMISMEDGQLMGEYETQTLTVSEDTAARQAEGGQMSSFSSWGVSSDLRLVPDITGIGGNVYSCYDGGEYGVMSGTSMSSPQVAGVSALVMQYLYELYPDAPDGSIRELAMALMMSTADPIISSETELEASPRQQGAGLIDAAAAVTAESYLTVGGDRPKAELGDSTSGKFTFSFEIHNISDEAQTYTLSSSLLTEDVIAYDVYPGEYFMAGYETELSGTVSFDKETVTVPAGGKTNVTATITLSNEDKAMFAKYWENGGYVEGYVYLTNEDGVDLSLPFMGFYGDWTQAPALDSAFWYDNSFWGLSSADGMPEGSEYYNILWTDLAGSDWVLGFNPYSGAIADNDGNIVYDPANNIVSPNGDGAIDGLSEMYLSLLRNAKTLTITFSVDGEILHRETDTNAGKSMYISAYGQVVPWLYSWYGEGMYDFTDAEGNTLPDGTVVTLTIDAKVDYELGGEHTIEIPIIVDTTAPELVKVYEMEVDGTYYLAAEASDANTVAAMYLMNRAGTQIYSGVYDFQMMETEQGTYIGLFEVNNLGTELMICVGDYGANEGYYNVTYTSAGDNLPEMDTSLLYAYRVFDDAIYSDHMYGWVSLDLTASEEGNAADISVWSDDYLEYAAINAAEYAGGKIFAVDAVYNLVVLDPGLWNRTTVCNLGVNVIDMTFDDSTDTMYVLTKEDNYYVRLYSMDMMTGELTLLKDYGSYYYAPWMITDDDNGTIYAIKYNYSASNKSYLYTLDTENDYAMTPVTDADGNQLSIVDSSGTNTMPQYSQSMTYVDGLIYWAYYRYTYYGGSSEMIVIDPEAMTTESYTYYATAYDSNYELVEYSPVTELVGLLSLNKTEWEIPEASELNRIALDAESVVLTIGQSATLTASASPWNYALGELTWTSSDESVATVADGRVTGVGEGKATITVSTEGKEATCEVTVANVTGNFNAYNYYSADGYYGYMIDVDLDIMDYYLVSESPVDFLAAEYNGHDGYYYGYAEGGQFYRMDLETGEAVKLGEPVGSVPSDMAYDYSTGMMYAITLNYSNGYSALCTVNLMTGELEEVYTMWYTYMMTLACDLEGNLYTITSDGMLAQLSYVYDDWFEEYSWAANVLMMDMGYLSYMQSMCYDYANDVILWAYPEEATVYWIDLDGGYAISLGDPTSSGSFEFVGMYTVPETIPELPGVAVESAEASDMMMLVGSTKYPNASVRPFNATCKSISWTSSDASVVSVNKDGALVGVSAGTAVVSGELTDTVSGQTFELSFNVTVLQGADEIYGQVMTDLATYGGQYWIRLYATDPSNRDNLISTAYIIFAEEYYNGKLYAYGYDPSDWYANWQFFVMDASSYAIEEQYDMGEGFPFVYDMTYDYSTSTMYAVAGTDSASDLYAVNMQTGELILLMQTDEFFMSLTSSADGTLYAMERSLEEIDEETWSTTMGNAQMYVLDPVAGTVEWFADTGIASSMLASMAYDYDTDYIYWTALAESDSGYSGGLCLIDPETGAATNLGAIGTSGAQVAGLYIISENFPAEPDPALNALVLDTTKTVANVGSTVAVKAYTLPLSLGAEIVWTSSNERVATVADGVVTAVSQGSATITATASYNGVTLSASCSVAVLNADAAFLTWNRTDMGWSEISRADYTVVTNLTEGEEVGVQAIGAVGADVYGFDADGVLFRLDTETYERTAIGESVNAEAIEIYMTENGLDAEVYPVEYFKFEVRDMAYDTANGRMLVLGCVLLYNEYEDSGYTEIIDGNAVYSVDLTTGKLTELYVFTDHNYVGGLAVDENGTAYFYTTYNDVIYSLNVDNGTYGGVVSLQTQSLYGSYGVGIRQTMHYDSLTGMLYMQFTSNNKFYRMITCDPATGTLTNAGYIGEVTYANWAYNGDLFAGMVFVNDSAAVETVDIYRLYNINSGEHFYTSNAEEIANLVSYGWTNEGIAWTAPVEGAPVYRMYNPNSGDHHYTMNQNEVDMLTEAGWAYEGIGWNSASEDGVPVYRLWNPNADLGSHHYTPNTEERDMLVDSGWKLEGIGWYGVE